jgi:hypothetical protein
VHERWGGRVLTVASSSPKASSTSSSRCWNRPAANAASLSGKTKTDSGLPSGLLLTDNRLGEDAERDETRAEEPVLPLSLRRSVMVEKAAVEAGEETHPASATADVIAVAWASEPIRVLLCAGVPLIDSASHEELRETDDAEAAAAAEGVAGATAVVFIIANADAAEELLRGCEPRLRRTEAKPSGEETSCGEDCGLVQGSLCSGLCALLLLRSLRSPLNMLCARLSASPRTCRSGLLSGRSRGGGTSIGLVGLESLEAILTDGLWHSVGCSVEGVCIEGVSSYIDRGRSLLISTGAAICSEAGVILDVRSLVDTLSLMCCRSGGATRN